MFYVGKGSGARVTSKVARNKEWHQAAALGWTYQILKSGMNHQEAIALEDELLSIYKSTIVNKHGSKLVKELCFEEFNKIFYYDPTSPSGLSWKIDIFRGFCFSQHVVKAGTPAGGRAYKSDKSPKAWVVTFNYKNYLVHRIVWLLNNKEIDPNLVVDHKDSDPFNNQISNLKLKTHSDNNKNKKFVKQGGLMVGVREILNSGKYLQYRAEWQDEFGRKRGKTFSVAKYGKDEAFRLACETRKQQMARLVSLGFKYTEKHLAS